MKLLDNPSMHAIYYCMTILGNFDITSQLSWNPVKEMISTDNHTISYILPASYIILKEYNLGFEWLY